MSKSLTAIFATLLKVNPDNPGFDVRLATDSHPSSVGLDHKYRAEALTLSQAGLADRKQAAETTATHQAFNLSHSQEKGEEQELIFTVAEDRAAKLLADITVVFRSHGDTVEHFPFRLVKTEAFATTSSGTSSGASAHAMLKQTEDVSFPKVEFPLVNIEEIDGNEIFQRLFSSEFRTSIGKIEWQKTESPNKHQVYYYVCPTKVDADLRTAQIEMFRNVLSHASWADLYLALAKEHAKPLHVSEKTTSTLGNGPLRPHLDVLFRGRLEQNKYVMRFDYRGLVQCVVSPKFKLSSPVQPSTTAAIASGEAANVVQDKMVEIRVNYAHFMAYMSTLLHQGVFLYQKGNRVLPLGLNASHALQLPTLIDFGIDCSGSMFRTSGAAGEGKAISVFEKLRLLLKEIIKKLPESVDVAATRIRLSRFGDSTTKFNRIEFSLTEAQALVAAIDSPTFSPTGELNTALFQFLTQQFMTYAEDTTRNNVISVLLSDGGDNCSPSHYNPNMSGNQFSTTLDKLDTAISPPQFYSLEIGEDVDKTILETIKARTHGKRIAVGAQIENINEFYSDLRSLRNSRRFLHFYQETLRFKLPVIDGQVTVTDDKHSLDPTKPFTMNGVEYVAQRPDLTTQSSLVPPKPNEKPNEKPKLQATLEAQQKEFESELLAAKQEKDRAVEAALAEARIKEEARVAELKVASEAEAARALGILKAQQKASEAQLLIREGLEKSRAIEIALGEARIKEEARIAELKAASEAETARALEALQTKMQAQQKEEFSRLEQALQTKLTEALAAAKADEDKRMEQAKIAEAKRAEEAKVAEERRMVELAARLKREYDAQIESHWREIEALMLRQSSQLNHPSNPDRSQRPSISVTAPSTGPAAPASRTQSQSDATGPTPLLHSFSASNSQAGGIAADARDVAQRSASAKKDKPAPTPTSTSTSGEKAKSSCALM
jgi:hypothetical protein